MNAVFHYDGSTITLGSDDWLRTIRDKGFAGIVFDCDGTLAESSVAHFKSMQSAADAQGVEMSFDWYNARSGLDRISLFQCFAAELPVAFDVGQACLTSIRAFPSFTNYVRPIAETVSLLSHMHGTMPMAVATNAEKEIAEQSLSIIAVLDRLDALVSVSDGVRPKPAPDLFLLAAERMRVDPLNVVVVEDSAQGIKAAQDARMSVLHLQHGLTA